MAHEKVVVVAGAGPGNGAALARRFAGDGRPVALLARSKERADALAAEIVGARGYARDVGNEASVRSCFAAITAEMGEVGTLLFNAGTGVFADVEHITAEQFEASWQVNALGSFLCSREVIPAMKAAGEGTSGRAEIEDGAPSSYRPPWLETTIAETPRPAAILASSGSRMPSSTSLPGQMLRTHSMSRHVSVGSNCLAIHWARDVTSSMPLMRPAMLPKVLRLSVSTLVAHAGLVTTSRMLASVISGGTVMPFFTSQ
jgi:NAD(P)-dependent dehydrogenase (short-subunit alcohol dehydrogenase family)